MPRAAPVLRPGAQHSVAERRRPKRRRLPESVVNNLTLDKVKKICENQKGEYDSSRCCMLMRGILGGKAPRAEVESLRSRGYWSDFLS